jgi:hypothetical protein
MREASDMRRVAKEADAGKDQAPPASGRGKRGGKGRSKDDPSRG